MTASLKVGHAGEGYRYYTRQTASNDVVRAKGQGYVSYYADTGNPPGNWWGEGCGELGLAGVVEKSQIAAMFGECRHPDADRIEAGLIAGGMSAEEAMKATQLGRALQTFKNEPDDYDRYVERAFGQFEAQNHRLARRGEEGFQVKFEATRSYMMMRDGEPNVGDPDVYLFLAERGSKNRQPVSFYDVTFTPSKSVSVLWALSDERTRAVIERIHRESVDESLSFLQRHAAVGRQGTHSVAQVDLTGLIVARFDHSTSRSGDPNLHTHATIFNRGRTRAGKWLAVDGRVLHQYLVAASETYDNEMMARITRYLGLATYPRYTARNAQPVWEIVGVDQRLCEEFSSRRAQIEPEIEKLVETYKRRHGHAPDAVTQRRLAEVGTLSTRPEKDGTKTLTQELTHWRRRMAAMFGRQGEMELDVAALPHVGPPTVVLTGELRSHLAQLTVARLEEQRSRWTFAHVRAESQRQVRQFFAPTAAAAKNRAKVMPGLESVTIDQIRDQAGETRVVEAIAYGRDCVHLNAPETLVRPAALRRENGESVMRSHHEEWVTSQSLYSKEQALLAAGTRYSGPVVDPANATLVGHLGKHPLMPSQESAARRFLGSGLTFDAAVGPAGTGKTTTMKAFVEGAKLAGVRVVALSPTLAAASVLGDEIDAKAESVQMFIAHHQHKGNVGDLAIGPDTFILIDEIGMASTPHLAAILEIADRHGASVRGIGDPEQLGSPGAGGFLKYFHEKLGAAQLQEVMRFESPLERDATLMVRAGNPDAALHYIAHGRLHAGSHPEMLDELYQDWRGDIKAGHKSVMIARSNDDVRMLAGRAQADRVELGEVVMTGIRLDAGSNEETVNFLGVGDDIVTREVNRKLTDSAGHVVTNGALWTVTGATADGSVHAVRENSGATITLPAEYVARHVDLAYSSTIMRVQGRTVDVSRSLWDDSLSRQDAYVAISRGRLQNHIYAVTERTVDIDPEHPAGMPIPAREVMAAVIGRDGSEMTASATLEEAYRRADSLREWLVEYEYAQREFAPEIDHGRVRDVLQGAFGDHCAYVKDDTESWSRMARHVAEHDRADGDVVAALRARVPVHELASDPSPGRLVMERLGEVGPGRRTKDPELNTYLAGVEERIKDRLSNVVDDLDVPRGRDVDALRKAWGVRLTDGVDPQPVGTPDEAVMRAEARLERLRRLEATYDAKTSPAGLPDNDPPRADTRAPRVDQTGDEPAAQRGGTATDRTARLDRLAGAKDAARSVTDPLRALKTAAELAEEEKRGGRSL